MKLFLLRHAKARDTWPDAERELSEHGIGQVENLADILLAGTKRGGRAIFDKCTLASLTMEEPPSHDIEYGLWALDFLISPKIIR